MTFLELDIDELRDRTVCLCKMVPRDFHPDFVAYLARGGYLIGCDAARFFGCPLVELDKHRTEHVGKNSRVLSHLPRGAKHLLREGELRFRSLFSNEIDVDVVEPAVLTDRYLLPESGSQILLVDDSVDSGTSVIAARKALNLSFPDADIRVAVLNTFLQPSEKVPFDWFLMERTLLSTPSSSDSPFYEDFCRLYDADGYR